MQVTLSFIQQHWRALVLPLAVMAATMLVGLAARRIAFRLFRRWIARPGSDFDVAAIKALRGPFAIWVLMLAIHLGAQSSRLPLVAQNTIAKVLLVLFIISITLVLSRLVGLVIKLYEGSFTSLMENLARIVILLLGTIIALDTLGISVLPILTALGVGGIAIALALQDTLSNLFSGFYVSLAGQVRVGDYIKLDSGEEGYITDISWRSTSLRSLQNNVIIVPNAKMGKATITNYDLPEQSMGISVAVSVSYDSDLQTVEKVLVDAATKAVGQVAGLRGNPAPNVRLAPGFGASSLDFTLNCSVEKFADQFLVQHEIRKRVFNALREAKIEIPYPSRTIYVREDGAISQPLKRTGRP
jgi:small-conductance mechanosensitive channel